MALLTMLFSDMLSQQENPNQNVVSASGADGSIEVQLQRNKYGHYVALGRINGAPVDFLLDTGATAVAIPEGIARRLGLPFGMEVESATANGITRGYLTELDEVQLGDIIARDVRATILPNMNDNEVLLGMTFLSRLDFSQSGDTLILRSR